MGSSNITALTEETALNSRRPGCLIGKFLEYTDGIPSPKIFREWAAVSMIAGVLERRTWVEITNSRLYPNMFIFLVGNPGVGKSMAINEIDRFWRKLEDKPGNPGLNTAPQALTKAAFIDQLMEFPKTIETPGKRIEINFANLAAPELGTLIASHDFEFINTLNDLYDCRESYEGRTRGGGMEVVRKPGLNLIGGTQPKYLAELLPEAAYGMGLTSRIIMVYGGARVTISLFSSAQKNLPLKKEIHDRLQELLALYGEFTWEDEAVRAVDNWHLSGNPPVPTNARLQNYNPRRTIHVIKLAMVFSAARSTEMIITLDDYEQAKHMLLATEDMMPEIFKEMSSSPDGVLQDGAMEFLILKYTRDKKKPITEQLLKNYFINKTASNKIPHLVDSMVGAGWISVDPTGSQTPGFRRYIPRVKHYHEANI